jgi:hypothetical protein
MYIHMYVCVKRNSEATSQTETQPKYEIDPQKHTVGVMSREEASEEGAHATLLQNYTL